MLLDDVTGGVTRSDAVWLTLALKFVSERVTNGEAVATDIVSVVSMSSASNILIDRKPTDWLLFNQFVNLLRTAEPIMDGNYVPALDCVEALLNVNTLGCCALALMFLSDGRPSDKLQRGLGTWKEKMTQQTTERIATTASKFGRRLAVKMIGFGRQGEDFSLLESMASRCAEFNVRASFISPGLDPLALGDAMFSLTSTLASSKVEMSSLGTTHQRSVREVLREPANTPDDFSISDAWHVHQVKRKLRWTKIKTRGRTKWDWQDVAERSQMWVAVRKEYFGEGAERIVRKFREVSTSGEFVGTKMVAKETRFVEDLISFAGDVQDFHQVFSQTQTQAQGLAMKFNEKLATIPGVDESVARILFLDCTVYVLDNNVGVLVEKELPPTKYMKWNGNNGFVAGVPIMSDVGGSSHTPPLLLDLLKREGVGLALIPEFAEFADVPGEGTDSDYCPSEDATDAGPDNDHGVGGPIKIKHEDVLQAFSCWTHSYTGRKVLVCDLQGVLNMNITPPLFELIDPVIHYDSEKSKTRKGRQNVFGRTDYGLKGMHKFFETHTCSPLCHAMRHRWVGQTTQTTQRRSTPHRRSQPPSPLAAGVQQQTPRRRNGAQTSDDLAPWASASD